MVIPVAAVGSTAKDRKQPFRSYLYSYNKNTMRQLIQHLKTGETVLETVPAPQVCAGARIQL